MGIDSKSVEAIFSRTTPASLQSFKTQREHTAFVEPVKIRTEQAVLNDAVFLEFRPQMFEIVLADERTILHALLVNHITTDGKLTQDVRTPLTELGGTDGVHPIAHGDDGIEVVELSRSFHFSVSFHLNYRNFLGSCLLIQFT